MIVYLIVMAVLIVFLAVLPMTVNRTETVSADTYRSYLSDGSITNAVVIQNTEVPTGSVQFTYGGRSCEVHVTDVNAAISELEKIMCPTRSTMYRIRVFLKPLSCRFLSA